MELVLVRHGEPEWVREGLNVGDPPLTERGLRQAEQVAEALGGERFDEILVSPLTRARQTAAPLLDRLSQAEDIAPWLEEIRNPVWHGTPAEKAEAAYAEDRARPAHRRWDGLEGGEPVREFVQRIHAGASVWMRAQGIERVHDDLPVWSIAEPDRRVLFVAHAGTNSVVICHFLGLQPTPWEWERFVLGHASISRLEALKLGDGWTFSLTRLSDVEHLAPPLRTR